MKRLVLVTIAFLTLFAGLLVNKPAFAAGITVSNTGASYISFGCTDGASNLKVNVSGLTVGASYRYQVYARNVPSGLWQNLTTPAFVAPAATMSFRLNLFDNVPGAPNPSSGPTWVFRVNLLDGSANIQFATVAYTYTCATGALS